MSADKIVAQPGTLTGSIGVFAGKAVASDFWGKLGVTFDEVHTSDNAGIWSSTQDYTPEQWSRLEGWLDRIYDDFTTKVAAGRRLDKDKVLEIARGRVWTGEDAKRLGLVDELGGFPEALRLAREAARIPAGEKVHLKLFPKKKSFFDNFQKIVSNREEDDDEALSGAREFFSAVREGVKPLVGAMRKAGLLSEPGVLTMPDPGRVE
jgi:protease-4